MILFGNNKEQHILSLFAKGDDRAMDKLYGTYADYLAQVCLRYIGNREDLHDVLQEAFIRIFTGIHSFEYRGKGSLKAWLTRTVVNESLRFLRDHDTELFVDKDIDLPDSTDDGPETDGLTITQITDAIRRLPPGYRAVFNLFAIEGKSHKEIAEMLNIRPDTSASQFYKARNLLAGMLKDLNRQGHEV